jgi:hypothetical protein
MSEQNKRLVQRRRHISWADARAAVLHCTVVAAACLLSFWLVRDGLSGLHTAHRPPRIRLIGLTTGKYRLSFWRCRNHGNYLPTQRSVEVVVGHTVSGFDAFMPLGAIGTGVVTDRHGHPVAGICVKFLGRHHFGGTRSRSDGTYSVNALPSGSYTIEFAGGCGNSGSYAPQFYRGATNVAAAQLIELTAGKTTRRINASMQPGATITGTVTDAAGNRLNDVCISIVPLSSLPFGFGFGNLTFAYRGRLAPASYLIQYVDCRHRTYGSRWYKQKANPQSATPVTVTPGGTTTGIDETLAPGGSISGVVKTSSGMPVRACVEAFDATTDSDGFVVSDRTGHYTIKGLSSGAYQVTFIPCARSTTPLAESIRAGLVAVKAPAAVTGINGKLGVAGSISGTVRDTAGQLQAGVCVAAVPADPGNGIAGAVTGKHGTYQIGELGAGTYHVYVGDAFCGSGSSGHVFAPQWFKGQHSQATATDVTVTAGNATTDISARLAEGGTIGGKVTHQGQPVAGECVTAVPVNPTPDPLVNMTLNPVVGVTRGDGRYSLVDLLPGSYHVEFSIGCGDSGFATQWWQQATSEQFATTIHVSANATVTGIDASLP